MFVRIALTLDQARTCGVLGWSEVLAIEVAEIKGRCMGAPLEAHQVRGREHDLSVAVLHGHKSSSDALSCVYKGAVSESVAPRGRGIGAVSNRQPVTLPGLLKRQATRFPDHQCNHSLEHMSKVHHLK